MPGREAVSYTHLDVYKRQLLTRPWNFDEQVEMDMESFLSLLITAEPELITSEKVLDQLEELQARKTPGLDDVLNTALRLLPEPRVQFLTDLFNECLRQAYFPKKW